MPTLNRRAFLRTASAAGLVPALPAFSGHAATSLAGAQATASSRLLWASLYARAGSTSELTAMAGRMGLPAQAAKGVATRIARQHALVSAAVARTGVAAPKPNASDEVIKRLKAKLRDVIDESTDKSADKVDPNSEEQSET